MLELVNAAIALGVAAASVVFPLLLAVIINNYADRKQLRKGESAWDHLLRLTHENAEIDRLIERSKK